MVTSAKVLCIVWCLVRSGGDQLILEEKSPKKPPADPVCCTSFWHIPHSSTQVCTRYIPITYYILLAYKAVRGLSQTSFPQNDTFSRVSSSTWTEATSQICTQRGSLLRHLGENTHVYAYYLDQFLQQHRAFQNSSPNSHFHQQLSSPHHNANANRFIVYYIISATPHPNQYLRINH